jgi:diadenylate cyclase
LDDSLNVLDWSGSVVTNPFQGHEDRFGRIANPEILDAFVEFSKLDGAFDIRGYGLIQSADVFDTN